MDDTNSMYHVVIRPGLSPDNGNQDDNTELEAEEGGM